MKQLEDYARKRDFNKTTEPSAKIEVSRAHRFVIQKHAASRLHYDFRLEMDGVLKSWAVPKGIPFVKGQKHLAVQVEDHPLSYIDFEGTIPKGQYGGGTVMVWDKGNFIAHNKNPLLDLQNGKLHFTLQGIKLRGDWHLVRLRDGRNWLLIKSDADAKVVSKKADDTSALSAKTMQQLGRSQNVWQSSPRHAAKNSFKEKIRAQVSEFSRAHPRAARRSSANAAGDALAAASPRKITRGHRLFPLPFIEPMMAKPAAAPPRYGDWIYEIKFDGYRALAFKHGSDVRLFSRNEKDFGQKFPEIVRAIAALQADSAVLDGEIVALDAKGVSSFQLLQAGETGSARPPLFFYAFDLLSLGGKDLKSRPLLQRKAQLKKIIAGQSANGHGYTQAAGQSPQLIRFSDSLGADAPDLLKRAKKIGLEGLIGKRADSLYEAGQRSGAWIKLKLNREQEFVIGGYTDPEGSRLHFGAVLIGYYKAKKLNFCAKVGTGFDSKLLTGLHRQFQSIARAECPFANLPQPRGSRFSPGLTAGQMKKCHWVQPQLVCQIKFFEWTRDDKLRHPVFLGLREDKDASDVVRE